MEVTIEELQKFTNLVLNNAEITDFYPGLEGW